VTMAPTGDATFFATAAEFRRWLERNHAEAKELWVGFYKKGTGKPSITWPEAVAEALCFGWIDGVRRSIDEHSYRIRFTPRKPNSIWSAVNIRTAQELIAAGRMRPAGLAAFQNRREDLQGRYSFEQGAVAFEPWMETEFRKRKEAWAFFEAQPPSYRKAATWWVISAKRDETRRKRLQTLIEDSAAGRRIKPLTRPERKE
jgi:uncharacterized protein YdeI (YjbR/CyaY-like superfamily)